jgi:hypothetical protein
MDTEFQVTWKIFDVNILGMEALFTLIFLKNLSFKREREENEFRLHKSIINDGFFLYALKNSSCLELIVRTDPIPARL